MNKLIYFKLELKRNIKLLPYLLIGAAAISAIMGVIAFCSSKIMYYHKPPEKATIALATDDKSQLVSLVISSLSKNESISTLFQVKQTDSITARKMAISDKAIIGIIVPKDFFSSLSKGINPPIKIYFSSVTSIKTMIVTQLTVALQNALRAAEAGIYTNYDFYASYKEYEAERVANEKLDEDYLSEALLHKKTFHKVRLSATGSLDLKTYYIASGIMVVLLLLGCIFILRAKNVDTIVLLKLKQNKIGAALQALIRTTCIFITSFLVFGIGIIAFCFIKKQIAIHVSLTLRSTLINGALLCLCCSAIISFSCSMMSHRLSAILFLFTFTIGCAFVSGAFLPTILLPDTFNRLAKFLPTTYLLKTAGYIFKGDIVKKNSLILFYYYVGFAMADLILTNHTLLRPLKSTRRDDA
ncbi:MAG: ABC transporter permease [Lachnospiraceae bacterium]|nr:ABC transporter permease [Lachnospiraceae bacterium]